LDRSQTILSIPKYLKSCRLTGQIASNSQYAETGKAFGKEADDEKLFQATDKVMGE
jgi:hypothetical protein